jgi:hypothetical protein
MEHVMAKPTPCRITFTDDNDVEQQIRFHAVMVESHKAKSVITKFPVMTGYEVSRNAIKKNREFTVRAIISNTILENSNNSDVTDGNISKTMHKACSALVDNAQVCEVVTNLGVYTPVVFNSYDTKTDEKWSNAIMITLRGEQLQVKGALNKTAPTALSFTVLDDAAAAIRREELAALGIDANPEAEISECTAVMGSDYQVSSTSEQGTAQTTTYISTGQDPVTGVYNYDMHTDLGEIVGPPAPEIAGPPTPEDGLEDLVHTEQGKLKSSEYGEYYESVQMAEDGGPLPTVGSDIIVVGVGGAGGEVSPDDFDDSLPTAADIANSAKVAGKDAANDTVQVLSPTTFTKIRNNPSGDALGNIL